MLIFWTFWTFSPEGKSRDLRVWANSVGHRESKNRKNRKIESENSKNKYF